MFSQPVSVQWTLLMLFAWAGPSPTAVGIFGVGVIWACFLYCFSPGGSLHWKLISSWGSPYFQSERGNWGCTKIRAVLHFIQNCFLTLQFKKSVLLHTSAASFHVRQLLLYHPYVTTSNSSSGVMDERDSFTEKDAKARGDVFHSFNTSSNRSHCIISLSELGIHYLVCTVFV